MKKTTLRYGLFSGITLMVSSIVNYLIFAGNTDYGKQEIGGYVGIILSMVFVYFGIKKYRDTIGEGSISYLQALKVGLLIIVIPSLLFGVFDVVYVKFMDPDFMEKYYNQSVQQMKATMSPEAFQVKFKEMEQQKAMFSNVFFQFFIMASTVFLVGIAASALSALMLFRKPKAAIA